MSLLLALTLLLQTEQLERPSRLVATDWHAIVLTDRGTARSYQCLSLKAGKEWSSGIAWYIEYDAKRDTPCIACRGKFKFFGDKLDEDTLILKIAFMRRYEGTIGKDHQCQWTVDKRYEERPTGARLEIPVRDQKVVVNPATFVVGNVFWVNDDGEERANPKDASLRDVFGGKEEVRNSGHFESGSVLKLENRADRTFLHNSPPPGFRFRDGDSATETGEATEREAKKVLAKALSLSLGENAIKTENYKDAIKYCSIYIEIDKSNAKVFRMRGQAYHCENDYDRALDDYTEALKLDPTTAQVYVNKAYIFRSRKEYPKAIEEISAAIRIKPEASFYFERGKTYYRSNDYEKCIADYESALRLAPDDLQILNASAWLLATCRSHQHRDGAKAIERATKACNLTQWKNGAHLDTLAAAYAEGGDFQKAVEWQQKALMSPGDFSAEDLAQARERLQLFKQNTPYRET